MKTFVTVLTVLLASLFAAAQAIAPSAMPNVQIADRRKYVSDPAGLLSDGVRAEVNRRLYELRQKTSVEAVVAIPPSIGDMEPQQWCE
ncbi:MAG: TPM domain-containing protein, partial [Muribaculaceae bacterium]|nr:TPM domain-containing protein [Muribaculaceae bacterium]